MTGQRATIGRLLRFMAPLNGLMITSVSARIVHFLAAVALIAVPAASIAWFVAAPGWGTAIAIVALVAAIAAVLGAAHYLEQFLGHYVAFRLLALLRNECYERLEPLIPADTAELRSGDAIERAVNDCDKIEPFYAHTIAPMTTAVVVPLTLALVLAWLHPLFTLVWLPFVFAMVWLAPWLTGRLGGTGNARSREAAGQVNAFLTDSLQGLRDTVAFGDGERRRRELWRLGGLLGAGQSRLAAADATQRAVVDATIGAALVAMLATGVALATAGLIDPLFAIPVALAITLTGFESVYGFTNVVTDYRVSISAARRLFDLLDRQPSITEPAASVPAPVTASISLADVHFTYPGTTTPVLRGLCFDLADGGHLAIVGASGAGKSTIASLLLRFYEPEAGSLAIGGVPVDRLPLAVLRAQTSVVSQRNYIFNTTIGANIEMGRPGAGREAVRDAARRARLLDWIESLPEAFDTPVGEMGSRLSGGQRQRLAIARALLKDAPILVLDEATSNLDVETERDVNAAIAELAAGRTVITIAHRLSTVRTAAEILVVEDGMVAERGTHEALLARDGVYARLFELQAGEVDTQLDVGSLDPQPATA